MLHKGQESSSRKLVWVEERSFVGWGCSECAWVFNLASLPTGKPLDEMKRNFQMQLSEDFASRVGNCVHAKALKAQPSGGQMAF